MHCKLKGFVTEVNLTYDEVSYEMHQKDGIQLLSPIVALLSTC